MRKRVKISKGKKKNPLKNTEKYEIRKKNLKIV